jgi:phage gp37-like protein
MSGIIHEIEEGIIGRLALANLVPAFGTLIKNITRYSGEFGDENLERLAILAPFVLISHVRSVALTTSNLGVNWEGAFTLVCGAVTRRDQGLASRIGGPDARELGSRQIAELVRDLLTGQTFGLDIKNMMPIAIDEVYSGTPSGAPGQHFLSVTGIQFSTSYFTKRSTVADGGDVTALVEIHADWLRPGDAGFTDDGECGAAPTALPVDPPADVQTVALFGGV